MGVVWFGVVWFGVVWLCQMTGINPIKQIIIEISTLILIEYKKMASHEVSLQKYNNGLLQMLVDIK